LGVLILPEHRLPALTEKWSRAEGLGFDHAWTYDHIAWRELRDSPWFAAVPTLSAAAMVTSRIRLGTLVASPTFRHPVPFARELLTLDDLAGGRLTVGIGAGAEGWDTTVLGREPWSMTERLDRFAEFVDLLDRLLTDRAVTFEGRFWSAREARTHPGCVQQPRVPFAVAATGQKSMRVAARHASVWVTNGDRAHEGPPSRPTKAQRSSRGNSACSRRLATPRAGTRRRRTSSSSPDHVWTAGFRVLRPSAPWSKRTRRLA